MFESGIIKYGEDFMHSMENGGWDLTKVDKAGMRESKSYFRIRTDERTTWSKSTWHYQVFLSLNISVMVQVLTKERRIFFVDNIFRFTQAGSEVSAF